MRDARCVLLLLSKACSARRFALRAVLPCLGGGSHPLTRYGHTLTYVNIEGVPPQAAKQGTSDPERRQGEGHVATASSHAKPYFHLLPLGRPQECVLRTVSVRCSAAMLEGFLSQRRCGHGCARAPHGCLAR